MKQRRGSSRIEEWNLELVFSSYQEIVVYFFGNPFKFPKFTKY